ncbi:hypothetical protein GUITHDRAFT_161833 [Guillardia theta CCMP2712]|uniref:Protein kinase domain-containing protein n=1 Tax=Guillardia theta (strain CCMP2712) TaxID=905079 RepID=L1JPS7_GUITC|nr:hypothetical protein GUITHDRAFT_161833 [Guillardia theta CCMP2712]EKX50596.1 hypothetical protein GUITHDRAFT_161833 [Guillardia theta CCMP2712]|eukprot:XP_005837576.1 hypothetical protein GUITHDRAFT_161833 [Guillardia theta CCMP2712]
MEPSDCAKPMKSSVSGPYQIPECQECPFVFVDGDQVPLPRIDSRSLKLGARLGADESSNSQVYSAEYREPVSDTRHVVAVKTFQRCETDEELRAVHHEIGLLTFASNQLHHTARCIGWCENNDGSLAVVMKRYQQSLFAKLQQTGKFPLYMVIDYGKKIAMAMAELHAYNIVLCDMKPENILLDEFNNIAISDFGVSVLLKNHEQNSLDDHILHGTFNYMSPEAFDPHTFGRLSTKSDCWSFACCIIEMITGKSPGTQVTHCRQHPDIPSGLPEDVKQLLASCFSFDSAKRPSFRQIYSMFAQAQRIPGERKEHSLPRSFEEAKELWDSDRKNMLTKIKNDAEVISQLQSSIKHYQDVNEKLQEQLVSVVNGFRESQRLSNAQHGAEQGAGQNGSATDALKQCQKQKEIAKQMLRQESARTRELSEQVTKLLSMKSDMQMLLREIFLDSRVAMDQVSVMLADTMDQDRVISHVKPQGPLVRAHVGHANVVRFPPGSEGGGFMQEELTVEDWKHLYLENLSLSQASTPAISAYNSLETNAHGDLRLV